MREIKFRYTFDDIMYGGLIHKIFSIENIEDGDVEIFLDENKNYSYYKKSQFTGLKDKNGLEIFEGDIVTYTMENKTTLTLEIKYEEELARFYIRGRYDISHIIFSLTIDAILDADIEVIGNIYENKELLK